MMSVIKFLESSQIPMLDLTPYIRFKVAAGLRRTVSDEGLYGSAA